MTPLAKVPVIKQGDLCLIESLAINEYLDAAYPGPKLISEDPLKKAEDTVLLELCSQVIYTTKLYVHYSSSLVFFSI